MTPPPTARNVISLIFERRSTFRRHIPSSKRVQSLLVSQTPYDSGGSSQHVYPFLHHSGTHSWTKAIGHNSVITQRHYSSSSTRSAPTSQKSDNDESETTTIDAQQQQQPSSSPFATTNSIIGSTSSDDGSPNSNTTSPHQRRRRKRKKKQFIPRKAAVTLTDQARTLFQRLLESNPSKDGILLDYHQSSTGEPRMVFSFKFVTKDELTDDDEGVTLEINQEDGTPLSPMETWNDGRPKLYIHHNAFLKVLGATVDVNMDTITPILYDKEGFEMDPSA